MARLVRTRVLQPDGRQVLLYGAFRPAPSSYRAPELAGGTWQQRWNPLRREWVLVASGRQGRTFLPKPSACPLCPSADGRSTEIPAASFEVAVFDNRFPALRSEGEGSPLPTVRGGDAGVPVVASAGGAEVVVYSDQHDGSFGTLSRERLALLLEVWTERYRELGGRPDVRYVLIFENRGVAVGVTLHHPHGQILAYPFIPPVPDLELRAGRRAIGSGCRQCALVAFERRARQRMLLTRSGVVAYLPAYARWPYEVHVVPVEHRGALPDLPGSGRRALGEALQRIARAYDRLFQRPMPYMLALHQRPTDGRPHAQAHLHAEFYPVLRDVGKLKYLASSESAAGVFVNDTLPEERAALLRGLVT